MMEDYHLELCMLCQDRYVTWWGQYEPDYPGGWYCAGCWERLPRRSATPAPRREQEGEGT